MSYNETKKFGKVKSRVEYAKLAQDSTTDVTDMDINNLSDDISEIQPKKPKYLKNVKSPKDLWKWYTQKPRERWHMLIYFLSFILSIIFLLLWLSGDYVIYSVSGVIGLILCIFSFRHFRILIALREAVTEMSQKNREFHLRNQEIKAEIKRLDAAIKELEITKNSISNSVRETAKNLNKFEELNTTIDTIGKSNIVCYLYLYIINIFFIMFSMLFYIIN